MWNLEQNFKSSGLTWSRWLKPKEYFYWEFFYIELDGKKYL